MTYYIPADEKYPKIAQRNIDAGLQYNSGKRSYIINDKVINTPILTTLYINQHKYEHKFSFKDILSILGVMNSINTVSKLKEYIAVCGCPNEYRLDYEYDTNGMPFIKQIEVAFSVLRKDDEDELSEVLMSMYVSVPLAHKSYLQNTIRLSSNSKDRRDSVNCLIELNNHNVSLQSLKVAPYEYVGHEVDDLAF